ncbi:MULTISPECIES: MFS transporter [Novosphingopyxis]|uniref:MFS transporter n=1 Tax=Novosphingopyxis TaxID=2709686 RepID=UPI0016511B36|nr:MULTISPECIES: MFS transporter [Novosphingopyxis]MBH9537025.1 MFS transporter [Novosphingopyxis sp. YJ-S2-01]
MQTSAPAEGTIDPDAKTPAYAWYLLSVLILVYILNFIDRQVLSILAEDVKRDLNLTDGDIGFLYGTAFGVFYALFGIPLGRLADSWHRVRLMTLGLSLWSVMTALSGLARNGAMLTGARVGVGIGEATASPSAYSLISDWFPKKRRGLALSLYSSGLYLGGGLSLGLGGLVVQNWNEAYPVKAMAPLGLAGWQAAFLAVGLPGLLLALWVFTLREPVRGQSEGIESKVRPHPFRDFFAELVTILPPLTLIGAARSGNLLRNLAVALLVTGIVCGLIALGEPVLQWSAVGIGAYAVYSWASALRRSDPPTFALILGTPAFLLTVLAYGLNAFLSYSVSFWASPYALRTFAVSESEVGWIVGSLGASAGFLGVIAGGWVGDRLRVKHAAGRLWVVIFGAIAPIPAIAIAFTTDNATLFFAMLFPAQALASAALGAAAATTQDLVLPRMRGTATASFFIGTTLIGLALGPYLAGRVSALTSSLSTGVLSLLLTAPIALIAAIMAARLLPAAEASAQERARAAGEDI